MFHKLILLSLLMVSSVTLAQTETPSPSPFLAPGAEPAPLPPPPSQAIIDRDESLRFGLGFFFDNGDKIRFHDFDNGTNKTDLDLDTESAFGLVGSLQRLPKNGWGFLGSLNLYSKREIKNIPPNGLLNATGPKSSITLASLDANLAYRWNQFYIPFGLNISGVTYQDNGANPNLDIKARGGIGLQFGVGCMITPNLAGDLFAKTLTYSMKTSGAGLPDETNYGGISSLVIGLRYVF